ncbi:phosphoribosylformylglycinamidine cyclo-ligase [Thermus thermamylovorans]|uniref:Phosphoribosylformylglycinamidine cyclo-ligase n=1 Tax=Thermus thermamylovorans TaxID=2509362 RepID=A0A4Q9AZ60_9DEIN|nr:phosphoribosylformylglycinamidine cyclo-ligase [Thermus thermamylovorans]TBH15479.1 phosphoribosylformylglycinamidine cyclo-ligase [Thermus thermamylovorans]
MRYEEAGVHIEAKAEALRRAKEAIAATYTKEVLRGLGAFGGLFDAHALKGMRHPVLVATTDGVGTKTLLALEAGDVSGLGFDLVNHSVNDLLCQGATPLFFMDYLAASRLEEGVLAALLGSLAEACRAHGIPLLGGETAEMPGVYREGAWDVAGTLVGVVEREEILGPERVREGDVLLGLPSSGPHTNGYSLIRKVVAGQDLNAPVPELGESLKEALLRPHRAYLREFLRLKEAGVELHAIAHITGGGLPENLPRALPEGLGAEVRKGSWPMPPVFPYLQRLGKIPEEEMYRVFNMGLGLVLILPEEEAQRALALVEGFVVGRVVRGPGVLLL